MERVPFSYFFPQLCMRNSLTTRATIMIVSAFALLVGVTAFGNTASAASFHTSGIHGYELDDYGFGHMEYANSFTGWNVNDWYDHDDYKYEKDKKDDDCDYDIHRYGGDDDDDDEYHGENFGGFQHDDDDGWQSNQNAHVNADSSTEVHSNINADSTNVVVVEQNGRRGNQHANVDADSETHVNSEINASSGNVVVIEQ